MRDFKNIFVSSLYDIHPRRLMLHDIGHHSFGCGSGGSKCTLLGPFDVKLAPYKSSWSYIWKYRSPPLRKSQSSSGFTINPRINNQKGASHLER